MKSSRLLVSLAAFVIFCGCSTVRFDPAAERERLLRRDAEWAAAAAEGKDVSKIVSYWTDDAVVVPPGQPIVEGKAALRTFVDASLKMPGFSIRWKSEKPAFSPDGKMATLQGSNEMTMTGPDGKTISLKGRSVTVWRLEPDGQWRCAIDIWNDPPPATPAAK
ncbi:MAG: DUF4440 domain-containing protein [Thermoanaerobaculia bacterium]|nr:DUF4440 domain-containing protein [Thermoanaerobaculia bacterium]